jgi:hypothetical protein
MAGLITVGWYWWDSIATKEIATQAALKRCRELELQLLDETVAQVKLGVSRSGKGQLQMLRTYRFEFTGDGERRYQGRAEVLGRRIHRIELDPHTFP